MSANDSDPKVMGWMQGFPPPADKTVRFTDVDYFAFPKLRWTVCNFRQMMPSISVNNAASGARGLPVALDERIGQISFEPLGGGAAMTWDAAFDANYTDGIKVFHHGQVVYERYAGCLTPDTLHGAMSVTKSLTGLLAEMLVAEGKLDEKAIVGDLIPELKASAFGDATVRQVMDMTTGLDYSEDYTDPNAEVWVYAQAGSPLPKPKDYTGLGLSSAQNAAQGRPSYQTQGPPKTSPANNEWRVLLCLFHWADVAGMEVEQTNSEKLNPANLSENEWSAHLAQVCGLP